MSIDYYPDQAFGYPVTVPFWDPSLQEYNSGPTDHYAGFAQRIQFGQPGVSDADARSLRCAYALNMWAALNIGDQFPMGTLKVLGEGLTDFTWDNGVNV